MLMRYGDQLDWRMRPGGLYDDREPGFDEPRETKRDPRAVERSWGRLAGQIEMPMNPAIYRQDPPGSPNAGCYAIEAARLQGKRQGEAMARWVREGTFVRAINMASRANIMAAAESIADLDIEQFQRDLDSAQVRDLFGEDWKAARNPVGGAPGTKAPDGELRYSYPTFEFYGPGAGGPTTVVDYRDPGEYGDYDAILLKLGLKKQPAPTVEEFLKAYPSATTREVAVCCDLDVDTAFEQLVQLERHDQVVRRSYGTESWANLWLARQNEENGQ